MSKYKFTTDEFGISETGIHLLRSKFNYKTFDFKDITLLEINKGKLISNWIFVLLIGIALLLFSIFYIIGLMDAFNDPKIHHIYIEEILVPILPFFLGGYCVYSASRIGEIIRVQINGSTKTYPLTNIVDRNELKDFILDMKSNKLISSKLKIHIIE